MRHVKITLILALAAGFMTASAVTLAQEATTKPSAKGIELVTSVQLTKAQFEELTKAMNVAATKLEKSDPESAAAIRMAVNKAGESMISNNMDEVAVQLKKGLMTMAYKKQEDVQKALEEVLRILREGVNDPEKKKEHLAALKDFLDQINDMIVKQTKLERETNMTDKGPELAKDMQNLAERLDKITKDLKEMNKATQELGAGDQGAKELAELRDEVRDLIDKQEKTNEAVEKAPVGELPAVGEVQKKLVDAANALKDKLDAAAKNDKIADALAKSGADKNAVSEASKNVGSASKEMANAGDKLSKSDAKSALNPQTQALADLKAAQKALSQAADKAAANTPAGKMADKQADLAAETQKLQKDLQNTADKAGVKADPADLSKAAGEMSKAADRLGAQDPKKADEHQKEALKELEGKKFEMAKLQRQIEDAAKKPLPDQAKEQDQLAKDTKGTGDKMSAEAKKSGQPTPGQESTGKAADSQGKAGGKLGQGKPGEAKSDQDDAIKELKKVHDELADEIAREEEQDQNEKLAKIDQMLQDILEKQKAISKGTKDTYAKRTGDKDYGRKETQELTELSNGEGRLSQDVEKIRDMLKKEGTTIVFPDVLEDVKKDLGSTQKMLGDKDAGTYTQTVQADIEKTLQDLIDSVRKELADRHKKDNGPPPPPPGKGVPPPPPLVPPLAELKMLRLLEIKITSRTTLLDQQKTTGALPEDRSITEHKNLADTQARVVKMTEDMAKKLKDKDNRAIPK